MDELKVFWSKTALIQRNKIFEYWNFRNKSKDYSRKLNLTINSKLKLASKYPNLGKASEKRCYRVIVLGNYSIVYKKKSSELIVLAIFDNRQSPEKNKIK